MAGIAWNFNEGAAIQFEAPILILITRSWGANTVSLSSLLVNIPEMVSSASLVNLFAFTAQGVVELVWTAKTGWAASALTGIKVPL